jgi:hypothetical protein
MVHLGSNVELRYDLLFYPLNELHNCNGIWTIHRCGCWAKEMNLATSTYGEPVIIFRFLSACLGRVPKVLVRDCCSSVGRRDMD